MGGADECRRAIDVGFGVQRVLFDLEVAELASRRVRHGDVQVCFGRLWVYQTQVAGRSRGIGDGDVGDFLELLFLDPDFDLSLVAAIGSSGSASAAKSTASSTPTTWPNSTRESSRRPSLTLTIRQPGLSFR